MILKCKKLRKTKCVQVSKLSELDAEILKKLLTDGRMTYDELAKECGASKNKIWKRYSAMKRRGIIKGATTQVNYGHLGYAALATLLISVDYHQIERIMEFMGKITEIRAYRQYNSTYNVRAFATLNDLNELDKVKQIIRQKLPIMNLKTYIWTSIRNIPENLNLVGTLKKNNEIPQNNSKFAAHILSDEKTIDDVDVQIVQKLTKAGRISFTQIAKEMKLSTNTVLRRYYNLRKSGTVKVSIQINPAKIGYCAILDFNLAFNALRVTSQDIVESIAKIPNVVIITKTSGDFDLQVTAIVRNIEDLFIIQDKLANVGGVTQIEASVRRIPDTWPTPQQYISTV